MGGRGSFVNVDAGDFTFRAGGQTYVSKGMIDNVKVIEKVGSDSVGAPLLSHTANRIYATIQNGRLKYLTFYDQNHNQIKAVDLQHRHEGLKPHVHFNVQHGKFSKYRAPNGEEQAIINKIKNKMRLR